MEHRSMADETRDLRKTELTNKLNRLLRVFRQQIGVEGALADYSERLDAGAVPIYDAIVEACAENFEVEARKRNGRALKIGMVGPLRHTSFDYERWPWVDMSGNDSCDLIVVEEFELSERV